MRVKLAPTLLLLTWAIFFSRTLFLGQVYFLDDLKIIFYPLEHVYGEFQRAGELPEWSPLFGFGPPLLAWGQLGFFTPVHVVLRFFGLHPLLLLQASILIYFLLGLIGMYWFLRRRQLASLAAALGAVVYVFCGFNIGHLNHVNFYVATMVVPWLLVAIDRFLVSPSLPRASVLAIVAAIIPLSGQPQIALYSLFIGPLYGLARLLTTHYSLLTKIVPLTVLAGILAFSPASFAILPLAEFLPATERSGDLPQNELYEFSYPPAHFITLIRPYYFGNHEHYWGAKNFQELAAYVGLVPLLLAPFALLVWKKFKPETIFALCLLALALALAPGIHSPIYRFLIEQRMNTSFAIPGRFVYFFDVGVAILAALGLNHLIKLQPGKHRLAATVLLILSAGNLVYFGWNYNPLIPAEQALAASPLTEALRQYHDEQGLPPRLYAAESLPLDGTQSATLKLTDIVSPLFSIHQPFTLHQGVMCLRLPARAVSDTGEATITVSEQLGSPPVFTTNITAQEINQRRQVKICPPSPLTADESRPLFLSVSSEKASNIRLFYQSTTELSVYFVRVSNPTESELTRSQKNARLVIDQELPDQNEHDADLLLRHIQATAAASSARWIGALGIANFRAFIEDLFANDRDPFNGEGIHALVHNRPLVNMSGITHLTQIVPAKDETDAVTRSGYPLSTEKARGDNKIRLYTNPDAFPLAFLVPDAIFEPDPAIVRHRLSAADYEGRHYIYVDGPSPPADLPEPRGQSTNGTAHITRYTSTRVDIEVAASEDAWLVLTDNYTREWQTFVDEQPQRPLFANTIWRTAKVPAGNHTVSFQYHSPAVELSKKLT